MWKTPLSDLSLDPSIHRPYIDTEDVKRKTLQRKRRPRTRVYLQCFPAPRAAFSFIKNNIKNIAMRKYTFMSLAAIAALTVGVASARADSISTIQPIDGQVMETIGVSKNSGTALSLQSQYLVSGSDPVTGQVLNQPVPSFDQVANVPRGAFIAHIATADAGTIDVQRFIDPSTHVACYYSESKSSVISVNCVPVSATAI